MTHFCVRGVFGFLFSAVRGQHEGIPFQRNERTSNQLKLSPSKIPHGVDLFSQGLSNCKDSLQKESFIEDSYGMPS